MRVRPRGSSVRGMSRLAIWKIPAAAALWLTGAWLATAAPDKDFDAADGPNVRVTRHQDGSRTTFTRSPDSRTLTKKKFRANGNLQMLTIYRMDANGNPVSCRIHDGSNQLLYKVSYGYRKSDLQLVEERMYDARVVRKDPNGNEMPVQQIFYVYDDEGKRSAPIVVNRLPGKTFEEVMGEKSSALERNPFQDGQPANPNARPLKGR